MSAKKEDLIATIQASLSAEGFAATKVQCEMVLGVVLTSILDTAKASEQIRTPIGTFRFVEKAARNALNPRTGEAVAVPAYKTLTFKASSTVKEISEAAPAKKVAAKPAAKAAPAKAPAKKVAAKK